MFSQNIKIEDSDDEEPDFIQRLLAETDPCAERKRESGVSHILKF